MTKEISIFISDNGDHYSVELIELNHNIVCVIPTITLKNPKIPPELFQNVLNHIISLGRIYIKKIYFDNVRITYRFIQFQLFGHIRGALKKELRRPLMYDQLILGEDDYKWIESDFLPVFPEELDQELNYLEKRIHNMYWAFKKGKVNGIPYVLPDDYEIKYNYFFELDATDIKPVFEVYVNTSPPSTDGDNTQVNEMVLGKFKSLDVKLIFR